MLIYVYMLFSSNYSTPRDIEVDGWGEGREAQTLHPSPILVEGHSRLRKGSLERVQGLEIPKARLQVFLKNLHYSQPQALNPEPSLTLNPASQQVGS